MTRRKSTVACPITVMIRTSRKAAEALSLEMRRLALGVGCPATVRVCRVSDGRRSAQPSRAGHVRTGSLRAVVRGRRGGRSARVR